MNEEQAPLHYRIILRARDIDYLMCRASGAFYDQLPFYTDDVYPYTIDGLRDVRLMVEVLRILRDAAHDK